MSPKPKRLLLDEDVFNLECVEDLSGDSYVDVRVDTIPHRKGDLDYSESPELLRKVAQWLLKAADWLEGEQEASS
jgi:hypothetical protein